MVYFSNAIQLDHKISRIKKIKVPYFFNSLKSGKFDFFINIIEKLWAKDPENRDDFLYPLTIYSRMSWWRTTKNERTHTQIYINKHNIYEYVYIDENHCVFEDECFGDFLLLQHFDSKLPDRDAKISTKTVSRLPVLSAFVHVSFLYQHMYEYRQ